MTAPELTEAQRLRQIARAIERLSPERTDPERFLDAKQQAAWQIRRIANRMEGTVGRRGVQSFESSPTMRP